MDMPGVVFVLGRDPERWLAELNQPAHELELATPERLQLLLKPLLTFN